MNASNTNHIINYSLFIIHFSALRMQKGCMVSVGLV